MTFLLGGKGRVKQISLPMSSVINGVWTFYITYYYYSIVNFTIGVLISVGAAILSFFYVLMFIKAAEANRRK